SIPTVRGQRYAGRSQMSLISLVTHGLSGISVYIDVIFVRLLILSTGLIAATAVAMVLVVCYKLFTSYATPGWATTVLSTFLIIMTQAGIFMVGITLMLLSNRSVPTVLPALDSDRFIDRQREACEAPQYEEEHPLNEPRGTSI